MILCKTPDKPGYYSVNDDFEWEVMGETMNAHFTKEQFEQLVTALTGFGVYNEWEDPFGSIIRCYEYVSEAMQLRYIFDDNSSEAMQLRYIFDDNSEVRSIYVEVPEKDSCRTETIIEEILGNVAVYGREYTFDALMNLFPKSAYNEGEWLQLL